MSRLGPSVRQKNDGACSWVEWGYRKEEIQGGVLDLRLQQLGEWWFVSGKEEELVGGHWGSSGESWDCRLALGSAVFGCPQSCEFGGSKGMGMDRAEGAQVRSGATTWSAWQRRIEASCPMGEGSEQHRLQGCKLQAA